jgi:acyl carrier protein
MSKFKELRLIPDWPRIRHLLAERMGMSEEAIQAMAESNDSLDQVEMVMAVEEVLDTLHK